MMGQVFERRRLRVYVAGPISSDIFLGVHRGMAAGRQLFLDGLAPFVPHFDAYWWLPGGDGPGSEIWKSYLEYDLEYVAVCDALYRLSGASTGADKEVAIAKSLNIPVFYEFCDDYPALMAYAVSRDLTGAHT